MKHSLTNLLATATIFGLIISSTPFTTPKAAALSSTDLVAHWNMDEETGSVAANSVDDYDLNFNGTPAHVEGKIGKAFQFDGSDQRGVTSPVAGTIVAAPTSYSIAFWIKTESGFTTSSSIISSRNEGLTISICDEGSIRLKPLRFNGGTFCGVTPINDGGWHHVVYTYNHTNGFIGLLVDGNVENGQWTAGSQDPIYPDISQFEVNRNLDKSASDFIGSLDDIYVYKKVLSQEEVGELIALATPDNGGGNEGDGNPQQPEAPVITFTPEEIGTILVNHVSFSYSIAGTVTFQKCTLDDYEFTPCPTTVNLTNLSEGNHVFAVEAHNTGTAQAKAQVAFTVSFATSNGDDDTAGANPPSTGGSTTGGMTNGDDDTAGANPPSTGGSTSGSNTNGDDDTNQSTGSTTGGSSSNGDDDITPPQNETPAPVQQFASSGSSRRSSSSNGGGSGSSESDTISGPLTCNVLTTPLRKGARGAEVEALQELLNKLDGADLSVTSVFDDATENAVKAFQVKYGNEILAPWGVYEATGFVSITTRKKLNELNCAQEFPLTTAQESLIARYRNATGTPQNIVVDETSEDAPQSEEIIESEPIEVGTLPIPNENTNADQTAGAANASSGFFSKILNFFKNLF